MQLHEKCGTIEKIARIVLTVVPQHIIIKITQNVREEAIDVIDRILIAERLIKLRGGRKRRETAEEIGISVSTLAMYESGNRVPRDEIKVSIAHHYGKTVEEIFFDDSPHEMCGDNEQPAQTDKQSDATDKPV